MSWLKSRHPRDVVEPRDRSGPMDIDEPDPLARLDQYALPDQAYGEGPSRKRKPTTFPSLPPSDPLSRRGL
jgi:hypothetical protein